MPDFLPSHLKKYIAEQNYEKYTPVDQAVWRFILRQLKDYLSKYAHASYVEGLEKTGIEIEKIPRIEDISKKLEVFGWRALPVSGFIPPAAFMELQSLSILPIASDLRTLDHLLYTPAPDIVHEAAGHAPMLINPEFAQYLKQYAQVARKAILSKEDLDLYEAIRILSDLKEHPDSSPEQIEAAQKNLDHVSQSMTHTSEGGELSRMNWWTAEYGLIGDLEKPKIFGAGLLSSVGESKWCLSRQVKKIPLSVDCLKQGYDITEPQPQLFVAQDFKHLSVVLEEMAKNMAYQKGGYSGLEKARQAKTVNTVVLNSGLQISGELVEIISTSEREPYYLKFQGPCQLCENDHELPGHDKNYHSQGFGSPIGFLKNENECLSSWSDSKLKEKNILLNQNVFLEFENGIVVQGLLKRVHRRHNSPEAPILLLIFENCKVTKIMSKNSSKETATEEVVLFDPSWGTYDMAVGSQVTSVFGGPADRKAFGDIEDFIALQVPLKKYTETEVTRHRLYQKLRDLRTKRSESINELNLLFQEHQKYIPLDWLFVVELLEQANRMHDGFEMRLQLQKTLFQLQEKLPQFEDIIRDGIALAASTRV